MVKLGIQKEVEVEAKELRLYCEIRDMFTASLHDQDGVEIYDQDDGYVPDFMPGDHYGDYIILNIDIETGQITNWKKPLVDDLKKWIEGDD